MNVHPSIAPTTLFFALGGLLLPVLSWAVADSTNAGGNVNVTLDNRVMAQRSAGAEVERRDSAQPAGNLSRFAGGEYLQAIYNGDIREVRRLDRLYMDASLDRMAELKTSPIYGPLLKTVDINKASLLTLVMRKYLMGYETQFGECLRPDAVKFEIVSTKTINGIPQNRESKFYRVNPELADVFKNMPLPSASLATNLGDMADLLTGGHAAAVEIGTEQYMSTEKCQSPVAKRFEANLLELFGKVQSGSMDAALPARTYSPAVLREAECRDKGVKLGIRFGIDKYVQACKQGEVSEAQIEAFRAIRDPQCPLWAKGIEAIKSGRMRGLEKQLPGIEEHYRMSCASK